MKIMKVRMTFAEPVLGASPADPDIYRNYIGSKAPDASTVEDEVAALGTDAVMENKITVFPRTADGKPFIYDYQIKGYFKDACGGLKKVPDTLSSKIKAYKKEIDKLIFPTPRRILYHYDGDITICQRPLRASTPQGERIALAASEQIPAGSWVEFEILMLMDNYVDVVREWMKYGTLFGFGQWRSSGMGRFSWEMLELRDATFKDVINRESQSAEATA